MCPSTELIDIVALRRIPLSSPYTPPTSFLPSCPMRPRCTWRRARSMLPRPRSPCACARPRPAHPVRCAPPRPGASIVTTSARWPICPGRSIGCPSSCACANGSAATGSCPRRIFTERLPTVAAPWARRTLRLAQRLLALGVALGGQAGVRLGHAWEVAVSRNTLLRLLRRQPEPEAPTPRVLGVDDWALRKGHTYGTILVDLEHRQPIALLPDRTAAPVARWLREHPGVEVIARDRASAYAEGAREGAPQATQVADRFHLLQNLRETLDAVFTTHSQALNAVNAALRPPSGGLDGTGALPVPPKAPPKAVQQRAAQRAARRQALYDEVWTLHRQGWTVSAIAGQVGLGQRTIFRYLHTSTCPGQQHRSTYGRSLLTPYKDYLLARWNAGCRTARQLFRELQAQGYPGSYAVVAAYASRLRQDRKSTRLNSSH